MKKNFQRDFRILFAVTATVAIVSIVAFMFLRVESSGSVFGGIAAIVFMIAASCFGCASIVSALALWYLGETRGDDV